MKVSTLCIFFILMALPSCGDRVVDYSQPEFRGKIVFRMTVSQSQDFLYSHIMIAEEGKETRKLSDTDSCLNSDPDISPDGSKVVFRSCDREYFRPIKLVNSDGSGLRITTKFQTSNEHPMFSPDGRWIAFESHRDGSRQIFVMDSTGANLRKLTQTPGRFWVGSWSHDGRSIAYFAKESETDANWQIYTIDVDGTNRKQLTSGPGTKLHPTWSADGRIIAYQRERKLHFLSADGAMDLHMAQAPDSLRDYMYWSSDGDFLVFSAFKNGRSDVYRINRDGTGLQNLTKDSYPGTFPIISPWNDRIAYVADLGGLLKIFLMKIDGTGKERLAQSAQDEFWPRWGR